MAWPWSKESVKLREKANKYDKLSTGLSTDLETLQTDKNSLFDRKVELVTLQKEGSLEGRSNDKYIDVVDLNSGKWDDLLEHFQEGINKVSKGVSDANELATKYHRLADEAEIREAEEDEE